MGYPKGYAYLIEWMRIFSHDPREIPNMLKAMDQADLVLGSRYLNGVRVVNWPLSRLFLSKGASYTFALSTAAGARSDGRL